MLWIICGTRVQVDLVGHITEHHLYIVGLCAVCRVTAEAVALVLLITVRKAWQQIVVVKQHII